MARDRSIFAVKSVEELVAENERAGLRRQLGWLSLTGIGIAGIIGAGIFVFLGEVARDVAGPAVVLSILLGAVAAILLAFVFAEFAALVPSSGSSYVYAFATLGRFPAFLMGWFILNSYLVGNVAVAASWSRFFVSGMNALGVALPAALTAAPGDGGVMNLPAALAMVVVTLLIMPRIGSSTFLNNILVGFKLLVVVLIVLLGMFLVDTSNYTPFNPYAGPGPTGQIAPVLIGAAWLLFAYLGFETVAAAGGEARRPRRDLPIGIVVSVAVSTLLYIGMALVVTGMQPYHSLSQQAPVAEAFTAAGHAWAAGIITVGALAALTTVLFAFQLGVTRIMYAMAHDGFLPRYFDRVNPRTGTPWRLTIVLGVIVTIGAAFTPILDALEMAVLAAIAMYIVVSIGVMVLKVKRPDLPRSFSAPWVFPVLGIIVMLAFALWGFSGLIHLLFLGWLGLGLLVYGFYGHRRSIARDEERDEALAAEAAVQSRPSGRRKRRAAG
jgi:basic amino acid/polyamine antiporter, APA family